MTGSASSHGFVPKRSLCLIIVPLTIWEGTGVNSTKAQRPPSSPRALSQQTIVRRFEEQVERTPQATALVFAGRELTYRQLDDWSNRLALHLQSVGVGAESLVGIFTDRSFEMAAALLATLKAGGAYVPLDPTYPAERISQVLDDSRIAVVLSTERVRRLLPSVADGVHSLDVGTAALTESHADSIRCPATGANLAYVIYTSGSTGRPKGVMVEHRNVCSFFSAMDQLLGTEAGTWLAVTSISFDISVLELLWTLTRGFTVVLHGEEGTHTIAAEITRYSVTHFQSTPSLARMLAADPRSLAALGSVKKLLLGGEALPPALLATLRAATSAEIYNMYGPTETTIWSTAYRIPNDADFRGVVPIGWPLANTRAYALDADLQPVSAGETGELYLGGEGVVRGYWERPELTAERFLPDPFAAEGRMYRTGDLVRPLPDGNLEFLGRTDHQVKLRGYRIELGEIEAMLERLSAVRQVVVVAREDRPGDKRLVAYVVPKDGESAPSSALRTTLAAKLPEYMIPAQFVFLKGLPLTPNGKIDRNALPAPSSPSDDAEMAASGVDEPRNEMERLIEEVVARALGVNHVRVDANIFDLGATSLMMPEIQMELQRTLRREVSLLDLFEFHTVQSLAAHLAGDTVAPRISDRAQRRRAARNQEERS